MSVRGGVTLDGEVYLTGYVGSGFTGKYLALKVVAVLEGTLAINGRYTDPLPIGKVKKFRGVSEFMFTALFCT
jgi:hypothetical protein